MQGRRGKYTTLGVLSVAAFVAACGGSSGGSGGERDAREAAASRQCAVVKATDVQAVAGVVVAPIERGSATGAGGTCANFASADGRAYLGVNALKSAGDYAAAVGAVPADVYPLREPIGGLGDEAMLFKNAEGMRYLVARRGEFGVALFPMGEGAHMTDDQLRELARRALAARP